MYNIYTYVHIYICTYKLYTLNILKYSMHPLALHPWRRVPSLSLPGGQTPMMFPCASLLKMARGGQGSASDLRGAATMWVSSK